MHIKKEKIAVQLAVLFMNEANHSVVSESAPVGYVAARITIITTAAAATTTLPHSYHLTIDEQQLPLVAVRNGNYNKSHYFSLIKQNPNVYLLIVNNTLDRETSNKHNITVRLRASSSSDGPALAQTNFMLKVSNVNDNAPRFHNIPQNAVRREDSAGNVLWIYPDIFNVLIENNHVGEHILDMHASDADEDGDGDGDEKEETLSNNSHIVYTLLAWPPSSSSSGKSSGGALPLPLLADGDVNKTLSYLSPAPNNSTTAATAFTTSVFIIDASSGIVRLNEPYGYYCSDSAAAEHDAVYQLLVTATDRGSEPQALTSRALVRVRFTVSPATTTASASSPTSMNTKRTTTAASRSLSPPLLLQTFYNVTIPITAAAAAVNDAALVISSDNTSCFVQINATSMDCSSSSTTLLHYYQHEMYIYGLDNDVDAYSDNSTTTTSSESSKSLLRNLISVRERNGEICFNTSHYAAAAAKVAEIFTRRNNIIVWLIVAVKSHNEAAASSDLSPSSYAFVRIRFTNVEQQPSVCEPKDTFRFLQSRYEASLTLSDQLAASFDHVLLKPVLTRNTTDQQRSTRWALASKGFEFKLEVDRQRDNDSVNYFIIDKHTGAIKAKNEPILQPRYKPYQFQVAALKSQTDTVVARAGVRVYVRERQYPFVKFSRPLFEFSVVNQSQATSLLGRLFAHATPWSMTTFDFAPNYTVEQECDSKNVFEIDQFSGVINIRKNTQLSCNVYTFNVQTLSYKYTVRDYATVNVYIMPQPNNRNPRQLPSLLKLTVGEAQPVGTVIAQLDTFDIDAEEDDRRPHFSLATSARGGNLFAVDYTSGALSVANRLDAEKLHHTSFTVQVSVEDKNIAMTEEIELSIDIVKENVHSPVFDQRVYMVKVPAEHSSLAGTTILQVSATDADGNSKRHGRIAYSLQNNDDKSFSISRYTGALTLLRPIMHLDSSIQQFVVEAVDDGVPLRRTATATIRIVVDGGARSSSVFNNGSVFEFSCAENYFDASGRSNIGVVTIPRDAACKLTFVDNDACLPSSKTFHDTFELDSTIGALTARHALDREAVASYSCQVTCEDDDDSFAVVSVHVTDENDNAPVFEYHTGEVWINDSDIRVGARVAQVSAYDADEGENGRIEYFLESDADRFYIGRHDGIIRLKKPLTSPVSTLTVIARDCGTLEPRQTTRLLRVHFNVPVENKSGNNTVLHFSIAENAHVGSVIGRIADNQINNIRYRFAGRSANDSIDEYVELGTVTGELFLRRALDYERKRSVQLPAIEVVHVNDSQGDRVAMPLINVIINIDNVNDECPKFVNIADGATVTELHVFISENMFQGEKVLLTCAVKAVDPDGQDDDEFSRIRYRFLQPTDKFVIDEVSGCVSLVDKLDLVENRALHRLLIEACDVDFVPENRHCAMLTLNVNVLDVNDHAPEFVGTDSDIYLSKHDDEQNNSSEDVAFHKVVAIDRDGGDNGRVSYRISSDSSTLFSIDTITGILSIKRQKLLDLRKSEISPAALHVTVVASDAGQPQPRTARKSFSIHVRSPGAAHNDKLNQIFSDKFQTFQLKAATTPGDFLIHSALANSNKTGLTFALLGSDGNFFINTTNGDVYTASMLNFKDQQTKYKFVVTATDGRTVTDYTVIQISMAQAGSSDNNNNMLNMTATCPQSTLIIPSSVVENASVANPVAIHRFVALQELCDADAVTYRLVGKSDALIMNETTGWLYVNGALSGTADILVEALSKTNQRVTCAVHLEISNTTPQLTYNLTINDRSRAGTLLIEGSQYFDGIQPDCRYKMDDDYLNMFHVNSSSGAVKLQGRVADIRTGSYLVSLSTTGCKTTKTVKFNFSPNFLPQTPLAFPLQVYRVRVGENQARGARVVQLEANVLDNNNNDHLTKKDISYAITSGNFDQAFVIDDPFSGIIRTKLILDREVRDLYRLTITARHREYAASTEVEIVVADANDNVPLFPRTAMDGGYSSSREKPWTTLANAIVARDVDEGSQLSYRRVRSAGGNWELDVQPLTGQVIKVAGRCKVAATTAVTELEVQVSDGAHSSTAAFYYLLENLRNQQVPPQLILREPYFEATVLRANARAGKVLISDLDDALLVPNSLKHIYTFADGQHADWFTIASNNQLVLADSEQLQFYMGSKLVVFLTMTLQHQTETVPVILSLINDNDVSGDAADINMFDRSLYIISLSEDTKIGSNILNLTTKLQTGREHEFSIRDAEQASHYYVDQQSGQLYLTSSLDRESIASSISLGIMCRSRGATFYATVLINILDVNDNAPVFDEQTTSNATISAPVPLGYEVTQIKAFDADEADNGTVRFAIIGGNEQKKFNIHAVTGIVTVVDPKLDSQYTLIIEARDQSAQQRDQLANVTVVDVSVINTTQPMAFIQSQYYQHVREDARQHQIILTLDAVHAENRQVLYQITPANTFGIDSQNGSVYLLNSCLINYEKTLAASGSCQSNEYLDSTTLNYQIIAVDVVTGREIKTNLAIDIEPVDEFVPSFDRASYRFAVPQQQHQSTRSTLLLLLVGQVHAVDDDAGLDGKVVYTIMPEPEDSSVTNLVTINSQTGEIFLAQQQNQQNFNLQRLRRQQYRVTASSGRKNSLQSSAIVELLFGSNTAVIVEQQHIATKDNNDNSSSPIFLLLFAIGVAVLAVAVLLYLIYNHSFVVQRAASAGGGDRHRDQQDDENDEPDKSTATATTAVYCCADGLASSHYFPHYQVRSPAMPLPAAALNSVCSSSSISPAAATMLPAAMGSTMGSGFNTLLHQQNRHSINFQQSPMYNNTSLMPQNYPYALHNINGHIVTAPRLARNTFTEDLITSHSPSSSGHGSSETPTGNGHHSTATTWRGGHHHQRAHPPVSLHAAASMVSLPPAPHQQSVPCVHYRQHQPNSHYAGGAGRDYKITTNLDFWPPAVDSDSMRSHHHHRPQQQTEQQQKHWRSAAVANRRHRARRQQKENAVTSLYEEIEQHQPQQRPEHV